VIYPGITGQTFLVNCNLSFRTLWAMVSPFLSQTIHDNIQIFGHDWKKYLKNIVDLRKLPASFGGKGPKLHEHPSYLSWKNAILNNIIHTSVKDKLIKIEEEIPRCQKAKNEDLIARIPHDESTSKSSIGEETESYEQKIASSTASVELPFFQKLNEQKKDI